MYIFFNMIIKVCAPFVLSKKIHVYSVGINQQKYTSPSMLHVDITKLDVAAMGIKMRCWKRPSICLFILWLVPYKTGRKSWQHATTLAYV